MAYCDDLPPAIENAIKELRSPEVVWFRGHTNDHKLIPSLFRFENGTKHERKLFEAYRQYLNRYNGDITISEWETVIRMHHSYVPTRILAWTEFVSIALFCALIREAAEPCVFVLDPRGLNRKSDYSDIIQVGRQGGFEYETLYLDKCPSAPTFPVAIESHVDAARPPLKQSAFTIHGDVTESVDDQCPEFVRKVILDTAERKRAQDHLLSMKWLT